MFIVRVGNPNDRHRSGASGEHIGYLDTFVKWNDAVRVGHGGEHAEGRGIANDLSGALDSSCGRNGNELSGFG